MKPMRYFGLHMVEGVAEYRDAGKDPYRILINESTIKTMDSTFSGLPVYVHHVDEVDYSKFKEEADGVVVRSFYNKSDGKHWAEFIIFTDQAQEAIVAKKWKLSNAYIPKEVGGGGKWHGVDYSKEIKEGEYEHLAIVPDPRYAESIILTPEEFKNYNNQKEGELVRLANSKGEDSMFFKKEKVTNSKDLETTSVTLPKSKVEKTIIQLINEADEQEVKKEKPQMCNGEHEVMVGEHKMTVNELVEKHLALTKQNEDDGEAKENEGDKDVKEKALEIAEHEEKEMHGEKKNEEEKEKPEVKKENSAGHFSKLKNAAATVKEVRTLSLSEDKVRVGKQRYGSK